MLGGQPVVCRETTIPCLEIGPKIIFRKERSIFSFERVVIFSQITTVIVKFTFMYKIAQGFYCSWRLYCKLASLNVSAFLSKKILLHKKCYG